MSLNVSPQTNEAVNVVLPVHVFYTVICAGSAHLLTAKALLVASDALHSSGRTPAHPLFHQHLSLFFCRIFWYNGTVMISNGNAIVLFFLLTCFLFYLQLYSLFIIYTKFFCPSVYVI